MNNMFKKTLVAVALAGISATATANVDVTKTVFVSSEYAQVAGTSAEFNNVQASSIGYTFARNVNEGDYIKITIEGGAPQSTITWSNPIDVFSTDETRLELVESNGDSALYRISKQQGARDARGESIEIIEAGTWFELADMASVRVRVEHFAGDPDTNARRLENHVSGALFTSSSQYAGVSFAVTSNGDREISVYDDRQNFVSGGDVTFAWVANNTGNWENEVGVTLGGNQVVNTLGDDVENGAFEGYFAQTRLVSYSIDGNFAWLAGQPAATRASFYTVACNNHPEFAGRPADARNIQITSTSFSFDCFGFGEPTATFQVENAIANDFGLRFLPESEFNGSTSVTYNLNRGAAWRDDGDWGTVNAQRSLAMGSALVGEWELIDGTTVHIPYMPTAGSVLAVTISSPTDDAVNTPEYLGDDAQRDVYDAAQAGYGDTWVMINGEEWVKLGTASKGVTYFNDELAAALDGRTGSVSLEVFVFGADQDVFVYSGFANGEGGVTSVHNDSVIVREVKGFDANVTRANR